MMKYEKYADNKIKYFFQDKNNEWEMRTCVYVTLAIKYTKICKCCVDLFADAPVLNQLRSLGLYYVIDSQGYMRHFSARFTHFTIENMISTEYAALLCSCMNEYEQDFNFLKNCSRQGIPQCKY